MIRMGSPEHYAGYDLALSIAALAFVNWSACLRCGMKAITVIS